MIPHEPYPTETDIVVTDMSITYSQEADCMSETQNTQFLQINTENESGVYYVIKTDRWAFDDIDDLIKILNDFKSRMTELND